MVSWTLDTITSLATLLTVTVHAIVSKKVRIGVIRPDFPQEPDRICVLGVIGRWSFPIVALEYLHSRGWLGLVRVCHLDAVFERR
jgi:hypothetical protein